jgi:CRISPR/Cas system-associated protein Csm6
LQNIVVNLEQMQNAVEVTPIAALRDEIDAKLREDLRRFADARESLIHLFGLQTYADIMSSFATGERYVNRVWSASADGYNAEARDYIARAADQFRNARQQLQTEIG